MSKRSIALLGGLIASLAFAAATMQGCGSSSSNGGTDYTALCMQGCDKVVACMPDADATTISQIRTTCQSTCTSQANCSNNSARVSAGKACLAMSDCAKFEACGATIPACQSSTGTGGGGGSTGSGGTGGSGTGGTTGAGGTSGGAWTCTTAAQGCSCAQAGGTASTCTGSFSCCFTATIQGQSTCNCTNNTQGLTCAQVAQATSGSVVSSCPP